ncbi:MAG: amidohydrolase family protein [Proteobacteria bacterium]|nr:amidohydrolase family protein [Pseudomonadota bacterium]
METSPPPDPNTRIPAVAPPPGSWDVHCHVFGPTAKFPYREGRSYDPQEAPVENLSRVHDTLGFDRGVIVQSSIHGTDNSAMLYAMAKSGGRYRGVANLDGTEPESEIARLHDAGVRGVRFNFVRFLGGPPDLGQFQRAIDAVADFGWHVVIHAHGDDLIEHEMMFRAIRIPVVLDHMAHPDVQGGTDQKSFQLLLDLIRGRGWWTKICNGDRVSALDFPCSDVLPFARCVIDADPDRILWGTDWPHPMYRKDREVPNDCDLLELLYSFTPEPDIRRKVLVDNPERLYRA